jgi:hypothetical protein
VCVIPVILVIPAIPTLAANKVNHNKIKVEKFSFQIYGIRNVALHFSLMKKQH